MENNQKRGNEKRPFLIAANGHKDLYALLDEVRQKGSPLPIDFIKCPLNAEAGRELSFAARYAPTLLHGWGPSYSILDAQIPQPEQLRRLAGQSDSPFLSVHLQVRHERHGPLSRQEALERIAQQAPLLRQLSRLPLLLENVPMCAQSAKCSGHEQPSQPRYVTDPDFVAEALEAAQAGLLLDLAHARLAAFYRRENIHGYLRRFPLQAVRELHVSGVRLTKDGLQDMHLTLADEDWELLQWLLPKLPQLALVTHEYMGLTQRTQHYLSECTPAALETDLLRLAELRQRHAQGLMQPNLLALA